VETDAATSGTADRVVACVAIQRFFVAAPAPVRRPVGREAAPILGGQGKTGHLSTLQDRPFPVSGIEAD